MLLVEKGNWLRKRVDEAPKFDLLQRLLRKRTALIIIIAKGVEQTPALKGEECLSRKNQPQMAALASPLLNVTATSRLTRKQLRAESLKFPPTFLGEEIRRSTRVYPKTKVDHALRGQNGTLCWRYVVTKMDRGIEEGVDSTRGSST